jgi:hypothetical protein
MSDKKLGKEINVEEIDLERLKQGTVDAPGLVEFAHNASSAIVKPEDRGRIKGVAVQAMYEQADMQLEQIVDQMKLLAAQYEKLKNKVAVSERIYQAEMSFKPLIGKTYYLYSRESKKDVLSMVGPDEWGKNGHPYSDMIAKLQLLADHTWKVLD